MQDTAVSSDLVFESVEFTIWYGTGQEYIHNRLVREKRSHPGKEMDSARITVPVPPPKYFQKMPVP